MTNDYCYTRHMENYEREMREDQWDRYDEEEENVGDGLDDGFSSWEEVNSQFFKK